MKSNALQAKARNSFISAVLTLVMFLVLFIAIHPSAAEAIRAIVAIGLIIPAYFAFRGLGLLYINNKGLYKTGIYICKDIGVSTFGNNPHKILFLQAGEKNRSST